MKKIIRQCLLFLAIYAPFVILLSIILSLGGVSLHLWWVTALISGSGYIVAILIKDTIEARREARIQRENFDRRLREALNRIEELSKKDITKGQVFSSTDPYGEEDWSK